MKTAVFTACCTAMLVLSAVHPSSAAPSDDFHNKWPWRPISSATITTLPFQGVHGCPGDPGAQYPYECVAAYDLVIADDHVQTAAAGQVTLLDNTWTTCAANGHYGNFVDIDGKRYGHLAVLAPSVAVGANLLQGDAVGTQGATGNVLPCDYPTDQRGKHLHWEFRSEVLPYSIDGTATSGIALGAAAASTNSVIGEYSTAGATLRQYYIDHGGWGAIGWTHQHCPGACTLNMFANLSWGRMQDFQHDPDAFGAQYATIHVANWDQTHAYRVDSIVWPAWAGGALGKDGHVHPLSMAVADAGSCPNGSIGTCLSFQQFHLGYVWVSNLLQVTQVFCPDLTADRLVDLNDAVAVLEQFGSNDPFTDVDGINGVDLTDATIVTTEFGDDCLPQ